MQKMKVATIYSPYDVRIEEVEKPEVGPRDFLVKLRSVALCGSDLPYYKGTLLGITYPLPPGEPGHECAGEVVKVAEDLPDELLQIVEQCSGVPVHKIKEIMEGDRVYVEVHNAYAEYAKVPVIGETRHGFAPRIFELPESISFDEGTFLGLLASTIHCIKLAEIKLGDDVAIFGLGPTGLLMTQLARIQGADNIIGVDLMKERLKLGEELGASEVVNASDEDPFEKVRELTHGKGVDVAIEAVGQVSETINQAIKSTKKGGNVVSFGVYSKPIDNFDIHEYYSRQLTLKASLGNTPHELILAEELLISGRVKLKPLITHRLPFHKIGKGLEIFDKKLEGAVKVIIQC